MDARWTVKFAKAKPAPDGTERLDIAIPAFGYTAHILIDAEMAPADSWKASWAGIRRHISSATGFPEVPTLLGETEFAANPKFGSQEIFSISKGN